MLVSATEMLKKEMCIRDRAYTGQRKGASGHGNPAGYHCMPFRACLLYTSGDDVRQYLEELLYSYSHNEIDAVVLGCTHYPFVRKMIQEVLGDRAVSYTHLLYYEGTDCSG